MTARTWFFGIATIGAVACSAPTSAGNDASVGPDAADTGSGKVGRCCPVGLPGYDPGGWSESGDCADAGYPDPGCDCAIEKDSHQCDVYRCRTSFQTGCSGDAGKDAGYSPDSGGDGGGG